MRVIHHRGVFEIFNCERELGWQFAHDLARLNMKVIIPFVALFSN